MIESRLIDLEPYIRTVTAVLIHSLWQGTLIGLLAAITLSLLKNGNAKVRYALSCGAMAAVILAAAVTLVFVWPDAQVTTQHVSAMQGELISAGDRSSFDLPSVIAAPTNDSIARGDSLDLPAFSWYIFAVWTAGVLLFSVYHLMGWQTARRYAEQGTSPAPPDWQARFRRLCDDLAVTRLVSLLSSVRVNAPCVVGWIKPVLLVPVSMFTSLDPAEIEMILAHELAHIRRYDVLVNIAQTVMETLFFFNPAIWWLSRQIRLEREDCCDDIAIRCTGNRLGYARALANLEEMRMFQTSFGSAISGTPFTRRIGRIVGVIRPPFYSSVLGISGMLLIASFIVVAIGSLGGISHSVVQAGEKFVAAQVFNPEPGDLRGEWETDWDGDKLRILVYGRQSQGMNFALTPDEVEQMINRGEESFRIVRDAGTLFLEGTLERFGRDIRGSGNWYFRPDSSYMRFMGRYGLREDDRQKTFTLAIFGISRDYVAGMEERGYHDLTVQQLISAGVQGISPELVDEFRDAGYPDIPYDRLLSLCIQNVTPDDARRFAATGIGRLTADQLISARISGITPEFVGSFRKAGFRDLTLNNIVTLRAFGIDAGDFEDCYKHRFMDLSQQNMVWVCGFGITQKDVEWMQERGYTDMDTIIQMLAQEYGK